MHDLIASSPVLVQLAVIPIVGSLIGFVYALLTRRAEVGLQGFGAKIGVADSARYWVPGCLQIISQRRS